jgi:hypothetical protein
MKPIVDRNTFDSVWLVVATKNNSYTKFTHSPVRERSGARNIIKAALKEAIVDHHKHAKVVATLLRKYGFDRTSKILSSQLPRNQRTRMGNFGEVVSSEHLRQRYGYKMPVFKLRYAENFLMPTRGEDIICFELGQKSKVEAICIGEAKTLASYRTSSVKEAYDRLANAFHPFPVSLSLIVNILYERGDDQLADQIEEIIATLPSQSFPCKNWIFIITGNEAENPFDSIQETQQAVQKLSCVDVYLPELEALVNEVFESPLTR